MADLPAAPARPPWHRMVLADRSGAVVLEYALIGGLVAIMAISALTLFAGSTTGVWAVIAQEINSALGG
jgi:Flp pilus assembly pilin Flp